MIHKSDLKSVINNNDASSKALFLGETLFLSGKILEAQKALDGYIVANEKNSKKYIPFSYALDLMGQCHAAHQNFALAKDYYERATGINPDCEYAHHNLGILYTKLSDMNLNEDFEKGCEWFYLAQSSFNECLLLNSKNPYFLHSKAIWHQKYVRVLERSEGDQDELFSTITKNFQLAINQYLKSALCCTENEEDFKRMVHSNLTECFMQVGHHLFHKGRNHLRSAQKMYFSALKINPNHLDATKHVGVTFCNQKNFVEARKYFTHIFKITLDKNEHAQAWLNIASTYRLEEKWWDALMAIDSALKLAPNNAWYCAEKKALIKAIPQTHQSLFNGTNSVSNETCTENDESLFMLSGSR